MEVKANVSYQTGQVERTILSFLKNKTRWIQQSFIEQWCSALHIPFK